LVTELKKAIELMTPEYAESLRSACIKKATDFSYEKMREKILTF
jgi:hypothetical protein